ncbi:MAG: NAD-dependent deacylase [Tissierellia bacterium]|nr:NAD-dependent deacylase [Tissierellia bacterium]
MKRAIEELAAIIKNSKNTVVMTGAGMDTESNIPDFRSKDGWWNKVDPMKVANIDAFYEHYPTFHEFYSARIKSLDRVVPHKGHYVLADLERAGYIKSIATQNISGLHSQAGSKTVYELHGNLRRIRCNECYQEHSIDDFLTKAACNYCGKKALRPDVVLFGETLPASIWDKAIKDVEDSDALIIIGTSLQVYPVNQFPYMTRGKVVFINMERVDGYNFDLEIIGKAGEILNELGHILL